MLPYWLSCVEPLVFIAQVGSAFFDTGLLMVAKERSNDTDGHIPGGKAQQNEISNFYMVYNMISGFMPFVPAFLLARIGDKKNRKIPICCPLVGYLLSRCLLLLVIVYHWPLQVMYAAATLRGMAGSFTSYWAGIMALASEESNERRRSFRLVTIELVYGIAGFLGSIASGHIFNVFTVRRSHGTLLAALSVGLYAICLLYSLFLLKVPKAAAASPTERESAVNSGSAIGDSSERTKLLLRRASNTGLTAAGQTLPSIDRVTIGLLFVGSTLYNVSVDGAVDILPTFVVTKPLNWTAEQVGYGNAAGFVIFITSFLGVTVFSRCARDTTIIIIGIVSFLSGMLVMAFVVKTYQFYIARALNLFALMTMPTIRSMLSKQVDASSYGKIFVLLELSFTLASVVTSPIFTKIYQATLDWFAGFCFILSSILSFLAIIPIGVVAYRTRQQHGYEPIPSS